MDFGSESPNTCPVHFGVPIPEGAECFVCRKAGLRVEVCDPSRAGAVIEAIEAEGLRYVSTRSRVILVFRRAEAGVAEPERKPLARIQPPATRRRADGRRA